MKKDVDNFVNITSEGKMTGTLSIGGAIKHALQGLLDLHKIMVNGIAYIIIHTKEYPNGAGFIGLQD